MKNDERLKHIEQYQSNIDKLNDEIAELRVEKNKIVKNRQRAIYGEGEFNPAQDNLPGINKK